MLALLAWFHALVLKTLQRSRARSRAKKPLLSLFDKGKTCFRLEKSVASLRHPAEHLKFWLPLVEVGCLRCNRIWLQKWRSRNVEEHLFMLPMVLFGCLVLCRLSTSACFLSPQSLLLGPVAEKLVACFLFTNKIIRKPQTTGDSVGVVAAAAGCSAGLSLSSDFVLQLLHGTHSLGGDHRSASGECPHAGGNGGGLTEWLVEVLASKERLFERMKWLS